MLHKNLFIILLLVALTFSCSTNSTFSTIEPREGGTYVRGFDFSEYTEKGFMFTPYKYNKDYKSIGMVSLTIWPEVKEGSKSRIPGVNYGNFKAKRAGGDIWLVENIETDNAIDSVYHVAKDMGADAIIKFDINTVTRNNGPLEANGVEVTGFAIDRENE